MGQIRGLILQIRKLQRKGDSMTCLLFQWRAELGASGTYTGKRFLLFKMENEKSVWHHLCSILWLVHAGSHFCGTHDFCPLPISVMPLFRISEKKSKTASSLKTSESIPIQNRIFVFIIWCLLKVGEIYLWEKKKKGKNYCRPHYVCLFSCIN